MRVAACSRTDAGVHALAQKVSFSPPEMPPIDTACAINALNSLLPQDIRILSILEKPSEFHARHQAKGKAYTYLFNTSDLRSPFIRNYAWALSCAPNLPVMAKSANLLLGTHDFTGYAVNTRDQELDPIKTLYNVSLHKTGNFIVISVIGNSFLYKMVRRIVGFLLKVGKGQLEPDVARQVLRSKERRIEFDTAPPHGLYLEEVFYTIDEMTAYKSRQLPFLHFLGLPNLANLVK